MKILTSDQMRNIDRRAIDEVGIPDLVLMENAGGQIVDTLLELFPDVEPDRVLILCGKGNNGGDAMVVARQLVACGLDPRVLLLYPRRQYKGSAAHQLRILERIGIECEEMATPEAWAGFRNELPEYEVILDGLLGTGLTKPVTGFLEQVILDVNMASAEVVAVDIPSGLSGNSAEIPGTAIEADATVALACPKIPHIFPPAESLAGDVYIADIGIPEACVEQEDAALNLIDEPLLEGLLPPRDPEAHKGDFGHILVVAGSVGKPGAARMVGAGALRSGAGLVTASTPRGAVGAVGAELMEMMTEPLPETPAGTMAAKAAAAVRKLEAGKTVLAVGPGLSMDAETQSAIRDIVKKTGLPVILDADGLNAFAGHARELSGRKRPLLATPHPGEMGRLLGISSDEVQADRIGACRRLATKSHCCVVLKGYRTLVGTPEGEIFVNVTGNPGMASGGSGDVLTGVLAGLVAQGLPVVQAALLGVYVHGLAGDLAAEKLGEVPLMAGDILEHLPEAFRQIAGS